MRKILKGSLLFLFAILLVSSLSFSQVELTFFGQYNVSLSFPDAGTIHPDVNAVSWTDWWRAVFGPVLEQKNGFGFGARIAFNLVPAIGIEGTFEHIVGGFELSSDVTANLEAEIEAGGFGSYLAIKGSGGNIIRYYGNIVFNIPSTNGIYPYITAGLGMTQFSLRKGTGPDILYDVSPAATVLDIHYDKLSALTFNAGGGIKLLFSESAGLRVDARIFYCKPDFEQLFFYRFLTVDIFDGVSFTQTGGLTEASINIGLFLKF